MARCPKCQGVCRVPDASIAPAPPPQTGGPTLQPLTPLGNDPFSTNSPNAPSPFDPLPGNSAATAPKANPFGEFGTPAGGSAGPINPYASPSYASSSADQGPLTAEDVRMKLLGPAIGIVIGAILCLSYVGLTLLGLAVNPNQPGIPADEAGRIGYYIGMIGAIVAMTLPSLGMLGGAAAMFRGKGLTLAWIGAVSAVLPCNPCCLISLGFGIWGIVMLCDPRVSQAMQ